MDWYCATADGQRHGPVQASQPRERTDIGSIGPVQRDGVAPRQTLAEAAAEPGLYASSDACRRRAAAQATSSPVRGFDPAPSSTLATACRQAWLPSTAPAGRPAAGPRAMRPGPMRPCARPRQRTLGAVLPPVIFFVDGMGYGVTRDLLQ